MSEESFECPHCERTFATKKARGQHVNAKHFGASKGKQVTDDDPSFADLCIEASWNNDPEIDWVREMMGDGLETHFD